MQKFCRTTLRRFTTFPNSPSAFNQIWLMTTAQPIMIRNKKNGVPGQDCPSPDAVTERSRT